MQPVVGSEPHVCDERVKVVSRQQPSPFVKVRAHHHVMAVRAQDRGARAEVSRVIVYQQYTHTIHPVSRQIYAVEPRYSEPARAASSDCLDLSDLPRRPFRMEWQGPGRIDDDSSVRRPPGYL